MNFWNCKLIFPTETTVKYINNLKLIFFFVENTNILQNKILLQRVYMRIDYVKKIR